MNAGMAPNLHHLELFYHVARNGGITAAARGMTYGIQQPAISGQISLLEGELGVRLFQRRPFKLTPAGQELYDFLAPFFGALPDIAARISGTASRRLRLAAPATIIRQHLPDVLAAVRKARPDLELSLVDADQRGAFDLLERDFDRGGIIARHDELLERGRAGDVGALTDIDEAGRGGGLGHLETLSSNHAAINASSPASRIAGSGCGTLRGSELATALAIAAICAGLDPQHPPRILT
jgi:hypothetical protein